MSFFSLDSKFSQIMGRVFDLMMLNIIFLIMCIPIVTIGANFTAMYYVTLKMSKNEETYIFRTYWKSFRENFKQATAIWLILLAVLIVLILDLLLVMRMPGTITYLRFVFLVLIFFEAMVLSYVFPVLSRFDNTVKNTIKNSILMAIRHLPWTIMILLVNLCPLLIYVFSTTKIVSYLILLMFLLGFSTVALGCSWFFVNKIFPFYMPEEEKEVLTPEEESLRALEAMDRPSPLTERSDDAAPAETTDAAETASEEESASPAEHQLGEEIYCEALRHIVEAWEGKPDSFRAAVLRGVMYFVQLYHGQYSEERLVRALSGVHPMELYRVSRDNPAKLPGWRRYVYPIYTTYNGKCRKDALPMKF